AGGGGGDAGAILARGAHEWQRAGGLRALVEGAFEAGGRLSRLGDGMQSDGRGGFRRRIGPDDRRHLEDERSSVAAEHHSLLVRLGRSAPQPSIKEADDLLGAARLLDELAPLMTAGLAEVAEAERMRADAAAAAQRELAASEEAPPPALP